MQRYSHPIDVFVAGAGPAGLACAIACALRGLSVHVSDAVEPPIDKACGEGLLPDALQSLTSLGIRLEEEGSYPLHGIRFLNEHGAVAEASFGQAGRGVRRTGLHQALIDRAISLGVHLHWKEPVRGFDPGNTRRTEHRADWVSIRTDRQQFQARYLVGADGHHSRVGIAAGLDHGRVHSRRIGLRQHYAAAPWSNFVEVHWSRHGQAYVTPVSSGELCVAFVSNQKLEGPAEALALYPALHDRLRKAPLTSRPRGAVTLHRTLRAVATARIALIGDASGSVDAVTGMGMALSFLQAEALSEAIDADDLQRYQQAHRSIRRLPDLMSRTLLVMDRHPVLRTVAIDVLQRYPRVFHRLLEIHASHSGARRAHLDPEFASNPRTIRGNVADLPDSLPLQQ